MIRWRQVGIATAIAAAGALVVAALLQFLAPSLSYQLRDRVSETLSGRRGRPIRIALGVASGSYYQMGTVLNRYLKEKSGYELELVATAGVPENVGALLDPSRGIDLAMVESSSEEAARATGLYGLATIGEQYFFVIVSNDSPVHEFRELTGAVNPGLRAAGQAPTLGERVLEYYGMLAPPNGVSIVRPAGRSILGDFEAGHMHAVTRTQFLHSDLVDNVLMDGNYRLVPIRDNDALARALPGTRPGLIPAGAYGPGRRVPAEPIPTLLVSSLLVARPDLPGRVVRDVLDAVYDPRFARDIHYALTEETGRTAGDLPIHPAAGIYYHRNDLLTSDRLGRLSFVASLIAAVFTASQFIARFRRNERRKLRRRALMSELRKLQAIRAQLDEAGDEAARRELLAEADALLYGAEQDAAADVLDADGIQSIRSLHATCRSAVVFRPPARPVPPERGMAR